MGPAKLHECNGDTPGTLFESAVFQWIWLEDQLAAGDGRETVDAEWIQPKEVLRLAAAGERKVIFPTRMNVQLLAEAESAADCVARARSRELVTVLPEITERDGRRVLVLPPHAGYGDVAEPLENVM